MRLSRTPPKPAADLQLVPPTMTATDGEKRNGYSNASIDAFFKNSMTSFEYWSEMVCRAAQQERDCRARLAEFQQSLPEEDRGVLALKELAVLEQNLAAAIDTRRRAAEQLASVA